MRSTAEWWRSNYSCRHDRCFKCGPYSLGLERWRSSERSYLPFYWYKLPEPVLLNKNQSQGCKKLHNSFMILETNTKTGQMQLNMVHICHFCVYGKFIWRWPYREQSFSSICLIQSTFNLLFINQWSSNVSTKKL